MIASLITAGVLIRVARESRDAEVIVLSRPKPHEVDDAFSTDKQSRLDAKDKQTAENLANPAAGMPPSPFVDQQELAAERSFVGSSMEPFE